MRTSLALSSFVPTVLRGSCFHAFLLILQITQKSEVLHDDFDFSHVRIAELFLQQSNTSGIACVPFAHVPKRKFGTWVRGQTSCGVVLFE
jgi:hypothetical protein